VKSMVSLINTKGEYTAIDPTHIVAISSEYENTLDPQSRIYLTGGTTISCKENCFEIYKILEEHSICTKYQTKKMYIKILKTNYGRVL